MTLKNALEEIAMWESYKDGALSVAIKFPDGSLISPNALLELISHTTPKRGAKDSAFTVEYYPIGLPYLLKNGKTVDIWVVAPGLWCDTCKRVIPLPAYLVEFLGIAGDSK